MNENQVLFRLSGVEFFSLREFKSSSREFKSFVSLLIGSRFFWFLFLRELRFCVLSRESFFSLRGRVEFFFR